MIGIRLGIRSVDIVNLKLRDISLRNRTVHFVQSKTAVEITLPMPNEVANSIYRYVKYARPESDSPYLFLKTTFRHGHLKRTVCQVALDRVLRILNIEKNFHGFHSTRKTFATNVLRKNHDISKTATVLGHTSIENIDTYLNINNEKMKKCALQIQMIPYGEIDLW